MAEEQLIETNEVAAEEVTPVEETNGSEAAQTTVVDTGKGDPWIAMHKEREQRQALERQLSDPNFVFEQAKRLGLTEEGAEATAPQTSKAQPVDSFGQYRYFRELEQSQEKFPQLSSDPEDQVAVTALMQNFGLSPMAAAEKYYGKMGKPAAQAAKEREEVSMAKAQASTVSTTQTTSSDATEYDALLKKSRDFTRPKDAEKAQLELVKWRMNHK